MDVREIFESSLGNLEGLCSIIDREMQTTPDNAVVAMLWLP